MLLHYLRRGSKSHMVKYVLFGLLMLATIGLGMGSSFQGFMPGASTNVASIGGESVSAAEFDGTVRRVLSRQGIGSQDAYRFGLIDQILESEIAARLLRKEAAALGIRISDGMAAEQINRLIAPFITGGLDKKSALQRILMSQNMSETRFVETIRAEMMNAVLRNTVQLGGGAPPDQEVRDIYQYAREKRTADVVLLKNSAITGLPEAGDDVLTPLYQAAKERYAIPETRSFTLGVLDPADIGSSVDISDEDVRKIYDRDIETYTLPERRVMQQAVLPAQETAEAVAAKAKAGAALKDAVKEAGGKDDAYMGEQSFEKQGLVPAIADLAFAPDAAKGAVIGPVQTPLGWHVLHLKDIRPPEAKPFDDVKNAIREDLKQERLAGQAMAAANAIDDRLASGAALEDAAKDMKLRLTKYGPLRTDGSTPDSKDGFKDHEKDRTRILQSAFEMMEGEISPVTELSGGGFAVIRVDSVTPKDYKTYEQVKGEIAAVWLKDRQDVTNKQKAQDLLKALAEGGKTLADVARENGAAPQSLSLERSATPPAPLTPAALARLFETPEGQFAVAPADGGYILAQVKKAVLPDPDSAGKEDIKAIADTAAQGTQDEILISYLDHLREKNRVKINRTLLDRMYGPGSEEN